MFASFFEVPCIVSTYSNPCPSGGSDVTYLLRYLVSKYNLLKIEGNVDELVTYARDVLRITVPLLKFVDKDVILFFQNKRWFMLYQIPQFKGLFVFSGI